MVPAYTRERSERTRGKNPCCTARSRVLARQRRRFFKESFAQAQLSISGHAIVSEREQEQRATDGSVTSFAAIEALPPALFRSAEPAAPLLTRTVGQGTADILGRPRD